MSLSDIENQAKSDRRPPEDPVQHSEEKKRKHKFEVTYFQVSATDEQLEGFRTLDSVGKAYWVARKMRVRPRKVLEEMGAFNVPETSFDRERRQLVDAISEF